MPGAILLQPAVLQGGLAVAEMVHVVTLEINKAKQAQQIPAAAAAVETPPRELSPPLKLAALVS